MTNSDRIEKKVILRASRARIWRAISDAKEFGDWFRVKLEGDFEEGQTIHGRITYPGYEHLKVEMLVEKRHLPCNLIDRMLPQICCHAYSLPPRQSLIQSRSL